MFLFILESIGTQELILIGLVALIFLGPRRLPEIARKIGKMTADLRSTTNEFRSTWEREVNFEEETKALRIENIETESATVPQANQIGAGAVSAPEVKPIDMDRESFESLSERAGTSDANDDEKTMNGDAVDDVPAEPVEDTLSDKRSWL